MDETTRLPEEQITQTQTEDTAEIKNPTAVLRALESAKAEKARLAQEKAKLEEQIKAIKDQSESEIKKRDEVIQQVYSQLDPNAAVIPSSAAELLTTFQATERLEQLKRLAQSEGEQRALERITPQLEEARKEAERAKSELANLQKFQQFQHAYLNADGKPENLDGVYALYGNHFDFESNRVMDMTGNTIFNEATSKPMTPSEALALMRQGKLQGVPSPELGKAAFIPYNQASGGATPAIRRNGNGSRVMAFPDLQTALKSPELQGLTASQVAQKVKNGEIVFT